MKKILTLTILFLSVSIYSQNRYELNDEGNDKIFLSDSISKMANENLISDKPIVVIDGIPYRYQDLETKKLELYKDEIISIIPIDKQKGINIYGKFGESGVVIITTNRIKE
ncbi:hypothetical protein [Faecalibacter bovis]|uniref:TonB-dependent receptor plug domain-containing protein n=1 Tax=Faecalibacter bovis TaxID=2898187 RepID=A0ABX7XBB7_9FLAO|nr:hypothetical protein [Faecalibacter bovis]QTV05084.1 hypothetical protein J9309_09815 [Faecalibacter bovis]QTV05087.1 hypothetical protein J9309_09830 [Faecalibacter bovis]